MEHHQLRTPQLSRAFETVFLISEIILVILYLTCTEYGATMHPREISTPAEMLEARQMVWSYYPAF